VFEGTLNSWWTRIVIGFLVFVFCLMQRVFERRRGVQGLRSVQAKVAKAG
ncbi:MAG TPA: sugar ABC transporter permease YjfF, partial [Spirochaetia bacterium]|nr:sugar ABC transporter permease YjfF [Spirochaetia bacterium]